jgi:hypothetical protein
MSQEGFSRPTENSTHSIEDSLSRVDDSHLPAEDSVSELSHPPPPETSLSTNPGSPHPTNDTNPPESSVHPAEEALPPPPRSENPVQVSLSANDSPEGSPHPDEDDFDPTQGSPRPVEDFSHRPESFRPPPRRSADLRHSESKISYLTQAYFKPLFGSAEAIKQLFTNEGFGNFHSIKLHEKFGFVRFSTATEAELFVEHFNGFRTGNTQLTVELSRKKVPNHPPCKRLHISGYDPHSITERDLYWAVSPTGFVRHISFRSEFSFVDFDTVEDAVKACDELNGHSLKGKILTATFARSSPPTDLSNLTISLSDILPSDHEFWTELAGRLRNNK